MNDPWHVLRRHTSARIALGRTGDALPTRHLLEFQAAHARARDSVHMDFDSRGLADHLRDIGSPILTLHSAAVDRALYLQRPDLGRRLAEGEAEKLSSHQGSYDMAFILADGLSARAVHDHAEGTLRATLAQLDDTWMIAPVTLVHQGRVAIADEIGNLLGAAMTVILIGERPGLSSADSLGAYLTWAPAPGRSNAERNCISNIRPDGLSPEAAAFKLAYLMRESRRKRLSGIKLKDDVPELPSSVARPELKS